MADLVHTEVKFGFSTQRVPLEAMVSHAPFSVAPRPGDLVLGEVVQSGVYATLEDRIGRETAIFAGDRLVCVFGNCCASAQYEGYVPAAPPEECDILSPGGVCGEEISRHSAVGPPTRLRVLGAIHDGQGRPLQLQRFGLRSIMGAQDAEIILIVGSAMRVGKTMLAGALIRALRRSGFRVAATRVTGSAGGVERRYFQSCGAQQVLDFTDAGYPSTSMLPAEELQQIYASLVGSLQQNRPDYILVEVAGSMFQREARMLLENAELHSSFDHVFFAASDSLAAESGMRRLLSRGLPLRAISGVIAQSPLAIAEAEAYTGMPCLSLEQLENGSLHLVMPRRMPAARVADVIQLWRCA